MYTADGSAADLGGFAATAAAPPAMVNEMAATSNPRASGCYGAQARVCQAHVLLAACLWLVLCYNLQSCLAYCISKRATSLGGMPSKHGAVSSSRNASSHVVTPRSVNSGINSNFSSVGSRSLKAMLEFNLRSLPTGTSRISMCTKSSGPAR
eukprot:TRINITY_DN3760_c0_g1_i1.p1 TRINITY_DN3760_c0_g1~~TRINITY_DN3760_c0_g1_i1.p1  ORF type:complete len:152 (-),score=17.11 TRINITY_DN3760_c0_g1_i1:172-627(-)